MKLKRYAGEELRTLRHKLRMNQGEFWTPFQVTQSGGSRYEAGREIPGPVQFLLNLAFGSDKKAGALVEELREIAKSGSK